MKRNGSQKGKSSSELIDARIRELGDWRGKMLSRLRTLVKEALGGHPKPASRGHLKTGQ
jgi:hypothetical protein